ncbi:MAG: Protease 3 precursor, partial [Planctomycetota bacterium]
ISRSSESMLAMLIEAYNFAGREILFLEQQEQAISKLTVNDVNAALRKHLQPERLFVVQAGDFPAAPEQPQPRK